MTIESHTDDLALLLAHHATGPVDVLGISIGALIGLDLAARYPGLVRTVVAHEPPLSQVLDDPADLVTQQLAVEKAFAVNALLGWLVRHIGRQDTRLLWLVLGCGASFTLAAAVLDRGGVRGLRYTVDRFREALSVLAEAKAAHGRAVRGRGSSRPVGMDRA